MQSEHETYCVLIVEDDLAQLENLRVALSQQPGLVLEAYQTKTDVQQRFKQQLPDLFIADIILGSDKDAGFDLARELQSYQRPIPIIFLSERQSEFDIMLGHDLGAVDYLPKPVSLAVLQRKVTNILRLTKGSNHAVSQAPSDQTTSQLSGLVIDKPNLKAYWQNQLLALTITELEMLEQFAQQPAGSVISYQQLQAATQGVVERNTINTHICRIRQAFKQHSPNFDQIHNVYGRGYSWRDAN
ncbi:response regulator transcription factor [Thiomicrospira pelophila]|uniref:response regulator transcription factor n=1 Tax=Thiomicrospira pelophila TaxID=934 RepID=UPI0004A75407|nr:response regulator transcription factor [Thiomicrospira pelophila]